MSASVAVLVIYCVVDLFVMFESRALYQWSSRIVSGLFFLFRNFLYLLKICL